MTLLRYSSADPLMTLRREMDQLFSGLSGQIFSDRVSPLRSLRGSGPALNVWESEDAGFVEAELPGLALEDLDLTVQGNELFIRGERKTAGEIEGVYHRRERNQGQFSRIVQLPFEVNPSQVEANFRNGVLTIRLPKAESAKPRKIQVIQ
jgi:HSP20 family protein